MDWAGYLDGFHAERPGITEAVLRRSHGTDGGDPYGRLADAIPGRGRVLDLACGSAPLRCDLPGRTYLGVDASAAELAAARGRGAENLIRARALPLPLADGSVDAVACSMGLMLLTPLADTLDEIARVLAPSGVLAVTVPATGPLRPLDIVVVAGLLGVLGRRLRYPNDAELRDLSGYLARAGLLVTGDGRERYGYRPRGAADADTFVASLYLPGRRRDGAARRYVRALSRAGVELPVPIRRVVAVKPDR